MNVLELLPAEILEWLTRDQLIRIMMVLGILAVGFLLLRLLMFFITRAMQRNFTEQSVMLIRKIILYIGAIVILMVVLGQLGLELGTLLGAAGVAGIAFGFAAQTSVSNIISGMFLISEKSFEIGNVITVGDTTGMVLSIDLLSIKIRTFDNRFVRIPNEYLIKTEFTNITRFPIRRMDFNLVVARDTDLIQLEEMLLRIAREEPLCLDEPEPLFLLMDFTERGIKVLFGIWFMRPALITTKNAMMRALQKGFADSGIVPVVDWTVDTLPMQLPRTD
ncbi:MAG: mechanosensitive ion channel family protein [Spirochaeta sp.]